MDDGCYKILGEDYRYSGPVLGLNGDGSDYEIKGVWIEGEYEEGITDIYLRLTDLHDSLAQMIKNAKVRKENTSVVVSKNDDKCCVMVMDKAYKITTSETAWKEKTSYLCEDKAGKIVYYVDTIDECLGEIKRLIDFVNVENGSEHTSDLSKVVNAGAFEKAYKAFIEQADKNAVSKKAGDGFET